MAVRKGTLYALSTKKSKSNFFFKAREPSGVAHRFIDTRLEKERGKEMAISEGAPYVLSIKKPKTNI